MFNCKLTRNISLNPESSSPTNCSSTELASGGIQERIYIYNIDDVENLMFENDNRFDDTLIIDTIITSQPYYFIDCSSATYNESQEGNRHTHTLALEVPNTQPITEDTINDASNHRYLVAFRPKGAEYYRVFGWKEGAGMSYNMGIDENSNSYTITLSDESEYALMSCYADNFDLANKVFSPVFRPLYDVSYCEVGQGGYRTGYCIASYVVKVNSAGQALDSNNKLCMYSQNPQDAYKYQGVSDGGYHILGTYNDSASFDGLPVKIFDLERCPSDAHGTISISGGPVRLNTTNRTTKTITLNSSNDWEILENNSCAIVTPTSGGSGTHTITFTQNGVGCSGSVTFRNKQTYETETVDVEVNVLKIQSNEYSFPNETNEFDIRVIVEPEQYTYTYSVVPQSGLTVTILPDNTLHCVVNSPSDDFRTWTFTLVHSNDASETKNLAINILGKNDQPVWRKVAEYCEEEGQTKYRWVVVDGQTTCVGYDKYNVEKKQVSRDGGNTYADVVPTETRAGSIIERNSEDCGYVPPSPFLSEYLTFEVLENNTSFGFYSPNGESIQYSIDDGQIWTTLQANTNTPIIEAGEKIMWKGLLTPETPITVSSIGIGEFNALGGIFKVYGNVMSLIAGDDFESATTVVENQFKCLFLGEEQLVDAENLMLPAMTLAQGCYVSMFQDCTNLVTPPELPATTLDGNCYSRMFLVCTSLTTAPVLPATTVVGGCYQAMFGNCESLTTAPELTATTLASNCYNSMFAGCTSLNNVKCLATDISATGCTGAWLYNVSATGTFTKAASMSSWRSGDNGIPSGWTVQNA